MPQYIFGRRPKVYAGSGSPVVRWCTGRGGVKKTIHGPIASKVQHIIRLLGAGCWSDLALSSSSSPSSWSNFLPRPLSLRPVFSSYPSFFFEDMAFPKVQDVCMYAARASRVGAGPGFRGQREMQENGDVGSVSPLLLTEARERGHGVDARSKGT